MTEATVLERQAGRGRRRRYLLLAAVGLVAVLVATGCVRAASPRGWAQPAMFNGVLLVSTHTGKLDGVDPATGKKLWRFPDDWTITNKTAQKLQGIYGKPLVQGDTVYVADYNGFVYAFKPSEASTDKSTKKEAAIVDVNGPVIGGIALDQSGQTLYVPTGEGKLFALKAQGFAAVFSFDAGDRIWSAPTVAGDNVYFATTAGKLFAVNATTGKEAWEFSADAALVTTPVVSGNTVLAGGFGDTLYAIDASTGEQQWTFKASDWIWGKPLVDSGRVYFGDFSGNVYAVSLSDGKVVWDKPFSAGAVVRSGPALSGGTLVVGTDNGNVFGVNPASGEQTWGPVRVGNTLQADLLATPSDATVYVAPTGCIGTSPDRVYNYGVNATTQARQSTSEVC